MKTWGLRAGLAAGFLAVLLLLLVVLFPVHSDRRRAHKNACLSNVKKLVIGHLLYAADHDERFTLVDWVPAIQPYVKDKSAFRCPLVDKGGSGYAYNRLLAGAVLTEKDQPDKIALTFEVDDLHLGAVAERLIPLASNRHEEMLTLGFADGYAKRLAFNRLGSVWMESRKAPAKVSAN